MALFLDSENIVVEIEFEIQTLINGELTMFFTFANILIQPELDKRSYIVVVFIRISITILESQKQLSFCLNFLGVS